ncbi:hypothetical protein ACFE04_006659 [Oxalis oulophora]
MDIVITGEKLVTIMKRIKIEECEKRSLENLDVDILKEIFRRLSSDELWLKIASLNKSLGLICWQILFWENLGVLDLSFFPPSLRGSAHFDEKIRKMNSLLVFLLEGKTKNDALLNWINSLKKVTIPSNLVLSSDNLRHISIRTRGVKQLNISLKTASITPYAFREAMSNWINAEHVSLEGIKHDCLKEILGIGNTWEKLESLHIESLLGGIFLGEDSNGFIYSSPQVKKLTLKDVHIDEKSYDPLVKGEFLREIEFDHCYFEVEGYWSRARSLVFSLKVELGQGKEIKEFEVEIERCSPSSHESRKGQQFLTWIIGMLLLSEKYSNEVVDLLSTSLRKKLSEGVVCS